MSTIYNAFLRAVSSANSREAFLNLNGLSMYEMLRGIAALDEAGRAALFGQRGQFVQFVDMPRIEYAWNVVQTRRLPSEAPGDLRETGQVGDAIAFLASRAPTLTEWSGDSSQWSQEKKLLSMTPLLRPKVESVLAALSSTGYKPQIFYGWRSVAVQLELYRKGNTKVKFSFHNAQKKDGTPNAYAADIIDERYGWTGTALSSGFWKSLGEEAKKQGLYWGGDWANFRDWAHVQQVPNERLAAVKRESGL